MRIVGYAHALHVYVCKIMKKTCLFIILILVSALPLRATDTLRLNMQAFEKEYPVDKDGKWIYTYNANYQALDFDDFSFSHMRAETAGSGEMNYWDGFTFCTNGDDKDYGYAGSSTDWPTHQWGCMAGGGIDSLGKVVKGAPYLVAYWGYNYEEDGLRSLQVDFSDGQTHRPLGIWVCNHPWAYYGIEHDDGFAHSFADNGAQFNLVIHGLDDEAKDAGMPIVHHLAWFHNNELDISHEWKWVDLTSLGQVNGIYFNLESSDNAGILGMNTAAYFCFGGMEMLEHVDEIARPTGLQAEPLDENRVKVKWSKVNDAAYYRLYVDSVLVDSTTSTSFTFSGLKTYTSYYFFAQAVSAYGESSDWGYVKARTKDLTPPTPPTNVKAEPNMYKIKLTWDAGTDNIAVGRYAVFVNGKRETRTKYTNYTITGLDPDTNYTIEVETWDTSDNTSERVAIQVKTWALATDLEEANETSQRKIYSVLGQEMTSHAQTGQVCIVKEGNEITKQIIQ